jgi:hypothetical protein
MDMVLAVVMGVALSAACGFRVFVPVLIAAVAVRTGDVHVAQSFQWIGSTPALVLLSVATGLEMLGYCVPWVDHGLDALMTPAAVVAGTLLTASFITGMSPMFHWTLAVIAGGGAAAAVQLATVGVRAVSTATTGGLANPIVSAVETTTSFVVAILAIAAPFVGIALVMLVVAWFVRRRLKARRLRRNAGSPLLVSASPILPAVAAVKQAS